MWVELRGKVDFINKEKSLYSIFDWYRSQIIGWIVPIVACDWLALYKCPKLQNAKTNDWDYKHNLNWVPFEKTKLPSLKNKSLGRYKLELFEWCRWLISRASHQLRVIGSSSDWLTALSVVFVIAWNDYFAFTFTTVWDWLSSLIGK